ncbi:MAG: hypothetical protein V3S22_06085 [Candidatus Neomarinimicrobiota bacterium]
MEGFGYWFFLAALYLLSALFKKRQQKAARRKLDKEEDVGKDWAPPEFLQNVFSEFKEQRDKLVSEKPEPSDLSEHFSEDLGEYAEAQIEEEDDLTEADIISSAQDRTDKSLRDKLSERQQFFADYQIQKKENEYHQMFQNLDQVRQAIVLKEILGKPRALNRGMRN